MIGTMNVTLDDFAERMEADMEEWGIPEDAQHVTIHEDGSVSALLADGTALHDLDGWSAEERRRVLEAFDPEAARVSRFLRTVGAPWKSGVPQPDRYDLTIFGHARSSSTGTSCHVATVKSLGMGSANAIPREAARMVANAPELLRCLHEVRDLLAAHHCGEDVTHEATERALADASAVLGAVMHRPDRRRQ